jgi:hypothetical protein
VLLHHPNKRRVSLRILGRIASDYLNQNLKRLYSS